MDDKPQQEKNLKMSPNSKPQSVGVVDSGVIRTFATGATRDTTEGKDDLEGYLSPEVLQEFSRYMGRHRKASDGSTRDSDNWQKGMPLDVYMKSGWRHFHDWWLLHRKCAARGDVKEALCALLFNVQGYLFEVIKAEKVADQRALEAKIFEEAALAGGNPESPGYREWTRPFATPCDCGKVASPAVDAKSETGTCIGRGPVAPGGGEVFPTADEQPRPLPPFHQRPQRRSEDMRGS